ncbi:MAG: NAD/NADP octopine/nopaline dehydrogenase family protein [Deltaproteobacteria bacterium]|nr:NAD/NADP octopine/nopaline dehydrogenase family protein [Deltaproteobacteria bacterium]
METKKIAVLGAGHGGYGMAADLTLAGCEVHFYGSRERGNLEPVIKQGGIELTGIARQGFAAVHRITNDISEALEGVHVIMVTVQSLGHEALAELIAPHLEDGQTILLLPGNIGSILFSRIVKEKSKAKDIRIGETTAFPYAVRRVIGEARAHISQFLPLHTAGFPARDTAPVLKLVKALYPDLVHPAGNVLEVGLSNPNCFHLPICIMNTAVIEKSSGEFYPYSKGTSPSVIKTIEAVWRERGAVLSKLGLTERFPFEWHKDFFENLTPAQAVITGPTNMQHRMITEDCPYILVPLASLGQMIGVPTPVTRALITLASEVNGTDYFADGRNVERLGISGYSIEQLNAFLM